jgi:hypothetical protein
VWPTTERIARCLNEFKIREDENARDKLEVRKRMIDEVM